MEREGFLQSNSPEETLALARDLGTKNLSNLVLLKGDLGAGKTLFTRGYVGGLGIDAYVSSPSYTLMNEYRGGERAAYHLDLYRLNCLEEVVDIGLFDMLESGKVCLVEWPERIGELAKLPHLEVCLTISESEGEGSEEGLEAALREIRWTLKE